MNKLPKELEEVLILKEKGFTQTEIAKKLRISQPKVSRRLLRVKSMLRNY